MPASPGDQHKQPNGTATQNPFEEQKPHIQEYTAQQIATLSSRLNKRLGPEYIATRTGPGNSKVAYLPAEKVISLANEVFGFNGWSSSIQNIQIDYVEENPTKGTVSIGLSVVVRVTLKDGTYHEDIGYGSIDNSRSKAAAFEKAKKEGTTDALKRTMRNFGNVLGNCIYDKDYIKKVSAIKVPNGRFDVNDLHRHEDYVDKKEKEEQKPIMKATTIPAPQLPAQILPEDSFDTGEFDGAFDDCDFADFDNPDAVIIEPATNGQKPQSHPNQPHSNQSNLNSRPPQSNITPSKPPQNRPDQQAKPPSIVSNIPNMYAQQPQRSTSPVVSSQHFNPAIPQNPAVGFFSAKAADKLDGNLPADPTAAPKFNPYAESPSIRKTQGVDHSKTTALNRSLKVEGPVTRDDQGNIIKPGEPAKRVASPAGFSPVSAGRPGMTSAYRPPMRHGPMTPANSGMGERSTSASKRPPLGDVSNVQHGPTPDSGDKKRQRVGPGLSGSSENFTPG